MRIRASVSACCATSSTDPGTIPRSSERRRKSDGKDGPRGSSASSIHRDNGRHQARPRSSYTARSTSQRTGGCSSFPTWDSPRSTRESLRSIERGAKFYLDRHLFQEGQTPYAPWFRLHYPVHYYYDILVGLDVLTSLGCGDDPRMRPALDRLEEMRNRDGTWNLDAHHPDSEDPNYQFRGPFYPLGLEVPGRPSRWITTTALTVLRRAGR